MRRVELRWDPSAVETLLRLEHDGQVRIAEEILKAIEYRLHFQPNIYRHVRVIGLDPVRKRRLIRVRRLFLGEKLPYLVYFQYHQQESVVEILHIRHARQKSIERPPYND